MSKAGVFIRSLPESGSALSDVLREFDYGITSELDHNVDNLSTGTEATTKLEISCDRGSNWIELSLWDKNRFTKPLGSVRFVCGMKAEIDSLSLSTGKGIEKTKFNTLDDEIENIPDIEDKEEYKNKINKIRRVFLSFRLNAKGVVGVPNDPNSFESLGHKVGKSLLRECLPFMK